MPGPRAGRIAVGDPLAQATQMGPVASKAQLDKDQAIVREAVAAGASVLCGGERLAVPGFDGGYFFAPTILGGADAANPVEEDGAFQSIFGLTLIEFAGRATPLFGLLDPVECKQGALDATNLAQCQGQAIGAWI